MRGRGVIALVGALVITGSVLGPSATKATAAAEVTAVSLSKATYDGTDFTVRRITIPPGSDTGWHYHEGTLHGTVKSGVLTHVSGNCTVVRYRAGDPVSEPSGPSNIHIGRNLGSEPVVLDILYIVPAGRPLATKAAAPPCKG